MVGRRGAEHTGRRCLAIHVRGPLRPPHGGDRGTFGNYRCLGGRTATLSTSAGSSNAHRFLTSPSNIDRVFELSASEAPVFIRGTRGTASMGDTGSAMANVRPTRAGPR